MQHQTTHPIQTQQLLLPARAAIYARVSSDQQAERQTIGSQVSDLLARAAAEGRDIGEEFRFLDVGGTTRRSTPFAAQVLLVPRRSELL